MDESDSEGWIYYPHPTLPRVSFTPSSEIQLDIEFNKLFSQAIIRFITKEKNRGEQNGLMEVCGPYKKRKNGNEREINVHVVF